VALNNSPSPDLAIRKICRMSLKRKLHELCSDIGCGALTHRRLGYGYELTAQQSFDSDGQLLPPALITKFGQCASPRQTANSYNSVEDGTKVGQTPDILFSSPSCCRNGPVVQLDQFRVFEMAWLLQLGCCIQRHSGVHPTFNEWQLECTWDTQCFTLFHSLWHMHMGS
jgi:hypothetical protein